MSSPSSTEARRRLISVSSQSFISTAALSARSLIAWSPEDQKDVPEDGARHVHEGLLVRAANSEQGLGGVSRDRTGVVADDVDFANGRSDALRGLLPTASRIGATSTTESAW